MAADRNAPANRGSSRVHVPAAGFLSGVLSAIARLFDLISIQFLDRLPNAVTVLSIVALLASAQACSIVLVWFLGFGRHELASVAVTVATSALIGTAIVGFGQMQYRRARTGYVTAGRLAESLALARDEAQKASREKSQFLASMSHELRTPLNAIIGFAEMIKEETLGSAGNKRYVEYARDIHQSGHHLLSLINDILDLSKIESGQGQMRADEQFDIARLIADCCGTLRVIATKNEVELSMRLEAAPVVSADSRMVRQILINLVSNAIKFTPERGNVRVGLRLSEMAGAIVEVTDTGIGMDAEQARIALQPFGQVDSYQSRRHKGTGLGLPLAKAMVELLGGRLTIRSEPGIGTTASFNVPLERIVRPKLLAIAAAA